MSDKKRILVCDDDEMLIELLVYRLEARGFEVLAARDGGQAAEMAEAERPDAIGLDAMMPVMNGEQVLRQFRPGRKPIDPDHHADPAPTGAR